MGILHLSDASQIAALNEIVDSIDVGGAGTIKIYSGPQPLTANAAVGSAGTNVLLATLTYDAQAYGNTSAGGVASINGTITSETDAPAGGTASWARIESGASNTIFDCDVGTDATPVTGNTIYLNTTSITLGGSVSLDSFDLTLPDGT